MRRYERDRWMKILLIIGGILLVGAIVFTKLLGNWGYHTLSVRPHGSWRNFLPAVAPVVPLFWGGWLFGLKIREKHRGWSIFFRIFLCLCCVGLVCFFLAAGHPLTA